ncbi:coiled-coil domain-containing protein 86 [Brachyhypopomus gauderio]|uniref:coiled-coil domain-containing protein 86 n=1 Tax=Brachyhypopomus gauderio TaxID=698409 RepID=UPI004042C8F3
MATCSQDESDVKETERETSTPSPNVIRTRSGRCVQTPASVRHSEGSSRRARRPAVQKRAEELPTAHTDTAASVEPGRTESVPSPSEPGRQQSSVSCSGATLESDPAGQNQDGTPDEHVSSVTHKSSRKRRRSQSREKGIRMVPLGKPKSGRVWKDRNKQRFSAVLQDKPLRSSWQKKMEAKREKEIVKQYSQKLKDEKAREKEEMRKRREENLRRRAENEKKAEIVQVITNTAKLKRMKKKQLRKIEKRDTLSVLQKTAPAVKKAKKGE